MAEKYVPQDRLFLWWLGRAVSLRYAPGWLQSGFALSEDLPQLDSLQEMAEVVLKVLANEAVPEQQKRFAAPHDQAVEVVDLAALAARQILRGR